MFGLWILVSIMGVMSIPSEIKTEGMIFNLLY